MNIQKHKTLLFVGAHPDDETFGNGGTIARYVTAGVRVYYACATRGEAGTVDPQYMQGYATVGDLRWTEMTCAARILGLAGVFHLGYRDSGMPGSEDNKNPQALINAPLDQVAGKIVKIIREVKPQVVVTFDPIGGYRHPDHIKVHEATVQAFMVAGDQTRYPEAGQAFQPSKLYFGIFPHGLLKIAIKLMPLFGRNPHQFGVNKDIDLTQIVNVDFPIHAVIRLDKKAIELRDKATACHASQLDGGSPRRGLLGWINYLSGLFSGFFGERDYFMRAYPPVKTKRRENDLFNGINS
jgi:N-acetyl-1-D-myo-inositol-2-amino-2-deoxy-alpha-D-glucopyranoside deacetylase